MKVIALLKLDRFDDALQALEAGGEEVKKEAPLAWAYALYKTGHLAEAEQIALDLDQAPRGLKHVVAQAAYRKEHFSRAAQLYADLAHDLSSGINEVSDLNVNSGATNAHLLFAGQQAHVRPTKAVNADLQHFETAFNAACAAIAKGRLKQAEFYLSRAAGMLLYSISASSLTSLRSLLLYR